MVREKVYTFHGFDYNQLNGEPSVLIREEMKKINLKRIFIQCAINDAFNPVVAQRYAVEQNQIFLLTFSAVFIYYSKCFPEL